MRMLSQVTHLRLLLILLVIYQTHASSITTLFGTTGPFDRRKSSIETDTLNFGGFTSLNLVVTADTPEADPEEEGTVACPSRARKGERKDEKERGRRRKK